MTVDLPYPPAILSPNSRPHHMARNRAFQRYKSDCITLMLNDRKALAQVSRFAVTFHPPNRNRRDIDNAIAAFKAGCDALAFITGVDDSKFVMTYAFGEPVKHGAVRVTA